MSISRIKLLNDHHQLYRWLAYHRKDLLDLYFPRVTVRWTKENIIEDLKKYDSRSEWTGTKSYGAAWKKGWINEFSKYFFIWTFKEVEKEAKKYTNRDIWKLKSPESFRVAKMQKWTRRVTIHMGTRIKWSKENCIKEANKHKTKKDWLKKSSASYTIALRMNWMKECSAHLEFRKSWDLLKCKKDAKKYKYRSDWYKLSPSAYSKAHKNGWLEECCSYMVKK